MYPPSSTMPSTPRGHRRSQLRKSSNDMKSSFVSNFENMLKDVTTGKILEEVEGKKLMAARKEGRRSSWTARSEEVREREREREGEIDK